MEKTETSEIVMAKKLNNNRLNRESGFTNKPPSMVVRSLFLVLDYLFDVLIVYPFVLCNWGKSQLFNRVSIL